MATIKSDIGLYFGHMRLVLKPSLSFYEEESVLLSNSWQVLWNYLISVRGALCDWVITFCWLAKIEREF